MAVKHRPHLGAAQRKPEMAGLGRLNGIHAKAARFRSRPRESFNIQTHAKFMVLDRELRNLFPNFAFGRSTGPIPGLPRRQG